MLFPEGWLRIKRQAGYDHKLPVADRKRRTAVPRKRTCLPVNVLTKGSSKQSLRPGLAPFFCDVFVGEPMRWAGDRNAYMQQLDARLHALEAEGQFALW